MSAGFCGYGFCEILHRGADERVHAYLDLEAEDAEVVVEQFGDPVVAYVTPLQAAGRRGRFMRGTYRVATRRP
jgi:hypothetical protein